VSRIPNHELLVIGIVGVLVIAFYCVYGVLHLGG
jgi:hypothetical protein